MGKGCNVAAFAADMILNAKFGKNIGALSEDLDHVGLPAGPAFGIWGIIFAWELVFVVVHLFVDDFDKLLPSLTPWFCATQLMQGLWVPLFTAANPASVGQGGDIWLWASILLFVPLVLAFLQLLAVLASTAGRAYWLSLSE